MLEIHAAFFSKQNRIIRLDRVSIDSLFQNAGADLDELGRNPHHPTFDRDCETGVRFRVLKLDLHRPPTRDAGIGHEKQVKQQLDPVFRDDRPRTAPGNLSLLFCRSEILGSLFSFAGIDRCANRTRSTEGKPSKLQTYRGVKRRSADEIERVGIGSPLVEELETIVDCTDRRDHVMADTAAQECRQIRTAQGEIGVFRHAVLLMHLAPTAALCHGKVVRGWNDKAGIMTLRLVN
ncbi:hypothetical protein D3C73_642130 [compost metagenome]